MPNSTHTVFVYGTLLRGEANHDLLAGAECLGAATTREPFVMVDCGPYPALVADESAAEATQITGEVYTVDAMRLALLDGLEDAPRLYQRIEAEFEWVDRPGHGTAWLYVQPGIDDRQAIPSGDWRLR